MYTQAKIDKYMSHLSAIGKYKPDDIVRYRDYLEQNFGPKAPGGSPDNALPQSLYTNTERLGTSFGDDEGLNELLKSKGYSNIQKSKDGRTIVQDKDGKYLYDPQNYLPTDYSHPIDSAHPLNALEADAGHALPLVGMGVGGGMASYPGAAAGAFAGEGLRQEIGKRGFGSYQGDPAAQVHDATMQGGMAPFYEAGGKALNMLPVGRMAPKYFTDPTLGDAVKTGVDRNMQSMKELFSRFMSGASLGKVSPVNVQRMIDRPEAVMGMTERQHPGEPSNVVQNIANDASQELESRLDERGADVGRANAEFDKKYGRTMMNTRPILRTSDKFLDNIPVNEYGLGRMDAEDIAAMKNWAAKNFMTTQTTTRPVGGPMVSTPIQAPDISIPHTPISFEPDFAQGVRVVPGETVVKKQPGPIVGYATKYPRKNYDQIKPVADALSAEVGNYWNANPLAKSLPVDMQYKHNMYGAIKSEMHSRDPDYLGQADKSYSQLKDDARLLRSLETPGRGEGFISNIMGKNKTEIQDAARRAIPNTFDGPVQDLGAARDFNQGGLAKGAGMTALQGVRAGLAGGSGYAAHQFGVDPLDAALIGGSVAAMTDPSLHKYGLYYGSRASRPFIEGIKRNAGEMTPMALKSMSPWKIYNEEN